MDKVLISFGHGYSAQALARRLIPQGWQIFGTTRKPEACDSLRASGITPVLWPDAITELPFDRATHLLASAAPSKQGDPILALVGDQIARIAPNLTWAGYLSTTAVYGDHDGAWIDETTPATPVSPRGQLRLEAEQAWRALPDLPLHIFRLAGIYGPGRGPFAKVRAGTARRIIKPGQVFSRIHVEDIAQVLAASMQAPNPGALYNLCDDEPVPPQDVIGYAAQLLGLEQPPAIPFDQAEMTPMARSFYSENKRVRNDRIKDELGVTLAYPNYRVGLDALRATADTPPQPRGRER